MKAIVHHKYGSADVLELSEIDKPVPADDEILVRVCAISVNPAEWHAMTGLYIARFLGGLRKPKDPRLGTDFAGVVEAIGRSVTQFKPGDEVFGGRHGAFAEYVTIREQRGVVHKSPKLTFEQAASLPIAALTALQGLRDKGQIQPGQKVLINGAAGGVGTFAVQLAKTFGAEVTGVCSTKNVEVVRSIGADHVVDYTKEDFTRRGERYDLMLDISGAGSWFKYKRVLKPDATLVIIGSSKSNHVIGPLSHVLKLKLASLRAAQKVIFFIANINKNDLTFMKELIETGKVTPVIDRRYKLSELPEGMRYLGTGHARGKIVITVDK